MVSRKETQRLLCSVGVATTCLSGNHRDVSWRASPDASFEKRSLGPQGRGTVFMRYEKFVGLGKEKRKRKRKKETERTKRLVNDR